MQTDTLARALATVVGSRVWREKVAAELAERLQEMQVATRPLYVLKSKKQLKLRLQ
ncbi:hypothetical protein [Shinella sp. M27]|uniref:hypothetical protein n=1 Tax=Shinella sp. M27 TaxID=3368614 RepID=UPI003B9E1C5F